MSNDMQNDPLSRLKSAPVPPASPSARERALAASLVAFDAAQNADAKKTLSPAQGSGWLNRLKSMINPKEGIWTMDMRIPLGTAAVALLLLPLGYQLYSSTAITPVSTGTNELTVVTENQPVPPVDAAKSEAVVDEKDTEIQMLQPRFDPNLIDGVEKPDGAAGTMVMAEESAPVEAQSMALAVGTVDQPAIVNGDMEPMAPMTMAAPQTQARTMVGSGEGGMIIAPDAGGMIVTPDPSGDEFTEFVESPLKVVKEEPVSTFSIDVDTASYSYVRRSLVDGYLPDADAVRIEEMINYFSYDYQAPDSAETPFSQNVTVFPTPWNPKTQIIQIGIKGYVPPAAERKPANLVFLIDTSGSMDEPDKLPLLKRSFGLLVDTLSANDTVSIVAYAGSAGTVLNPTKAKDKAQILAALDNLAAGGSTAGAEGITLAYQLAEQNKVADGVNRVILATDGDFNVGIDDPEDLVDFIKTKRDGGVFLSVLGFGRGNLDDATMQALAQNGNGNAAYIDTFREAQKVLVEQGGANLQTIAKDVKIQVEFNPAFVSEYRLIGYETRALNREDFNNDKVDAGEIGAGHTVTALYEITPVGSGAELVDPLRYGSDTAADGTVAPVGGELAFLKLRYKAPEGDVSKLIEMPIAADSALADIARASDDARWATAVAAFSQKLKGSNYGGTMTWDQIRDLAQGARGSDESGYRAEFIQLINSAASISPDQAFDPAGAALPE